MVEFPLKFGFLIESDEPKLAQCRAEQINAASHIREHGATPHTIQWALDWMAEEILIEERCNG